MLLLILSLVTLILPISTRAGVTIILGGKTDGLFQTALDTVEIYSPSCGLFDSNLPPLPIAKHSFGATYLKRFIYICGGYNPVDEMKDCFKLDLSKPTEGWIQIAPMLKGRYNFALVTANGLIYAVGGQDLNSEVNDIEVYNPKLDMWTQSVQLNSYRIGFCAAVSQNQEELYIVGGIDKNGEKKRLESLDFETMEWTRLGDMYTERSDCACTTFKDDLIVAGGWGIEDQGPLAGKIAALKSVEFYNADHGVWADHPPMKHRRAEFSMDSTLNHDYNLKHLSAFGGYKSGHLDSVEMFEDEWMYLGRHLQEPKSKVAIVSIPSGLIKENC